MSLMSAGGRAFTPMMLASRTGVTSGRTRLSNEVTCEEKRENYSLKDNIR